MPRTLPTGVQTAVSVPAYRACLAVAVGTSTPIRVTDNPAGVTIGGNAYTAGFLTVGEVMIADEPGVTVRIANTANEVTAKDLDGSAGGGLIGKTLTVYEVVYDSGGTQLTEDVIYSGIVASFTADADSAELVGNLSELREAGMVGRMTTRLCGYVFKGARCGYSGGNTSCAHSYAACTTNSNTSRFGGFRTMPTLNTKLTYYLTEYVSGSHTFGTSVRQSMVQPPAPPPSYTPGYQSTMSQPGYVPSQTGTHLQVEPPDPNQPKTEVS